MLSIADRLFNACLKRDKSLLSSACLVDFGIDTDVDQMFSAFVKAVEQGCSAADLEKVRGKSGAIQKLLHKYGQTHITVEPTAEDVIAIPSYNKVTVGFVTQKFVRNAEGEYVCTEQTFTCGDDVTYENEYGEDVSHAVDTDDERYQPYNMEQPTQ